LLSAVERKIEQYIGDLGDRQVQDLYEKLPRGKRLRAKLILRVAGDGIRAVKTAAVVEMIHAASLLHDDVIDDAFVRRSQPSINALYGNKTAIMFGDILYSKGFFELVDIDRRIAKVISGAVTQLSLGELNDVALAAAFNAEKLLYMQMIYQKTASLIEASAEAAALLAGKNPEPYRIYGRNLGLAFQMIDDLLDITSDSHTLGKPAMHDFAEGKTTLPYIYLYEALDEEGRKRLVGYHGRELAPDALEWIGQQMEKHSIVLKCFGEARELIDEAAVLMDEAGEEALSDIAREMIERDF
jgi:octaprenyl-diphosphate synthase